MSHRFAARIVCLVVLAVPLSISTIHSVRAAEAGAPARTLEYAALADASAWTADLASPDARTRWDLRAAGPSLAASESIAVRGLDVSVTRSVRTGDTRRSVTLTYRDAEGGRAALAWLVPGTQQSLLRPGETRLSRLVESGPGGTDELLVEARGIAAGWADLAVGPYEVAVERSVVQRRRAGADSFVPDVVVTRWIDPRHGVVAETREPAPGAALTPQLADGGPDDAPTGFGSTGALILADAPESHGTLAIADTQIDTAVNRAISYGWNRGNGALVSSLTPDAHATMGDLVAASSWDFSGNSSANAVSEIASTIVPLDADHTCNINPPNDPGFVACGFDNPGGNRVLARQDDDWDDADSDGTILITNTVFEREAQAGKVVVWQRAGVQFEGTGSGFGDGESRFCFDPGDGKSEVPQWEFASDGSGNFLMQAGDTWSTPFACEQNLYSAVCGDPGLIPTLYSQACCTGGGSDCHDGEQETDVLKEGVVTLPSGHTLNTLLVRIKADYCVYSVSGCSAFFRVDHVRKFIFLWVAPHLSTVVRLQTVNHVNDATSFTSLEETDIKFGLFPPLSTSASAVTDTSVTLQWNPGNDTHRIDRYKVYWDTVSGGTTAGAYAFDSDSNPGQVTFNGTEATITGLTPSTNYFFTVTSLVNHTDIKSSVTTEYESLLFPTQVFGDPGFAYPTELMATTTGGACVPTQEVGGLSVADAGGGNQQFCWTASADPCVTGYAVLGSDDATSASGWTTEAQVGAVTCWTGAPADTFYLVAGESPAGQGPWGHYGQ